jgi:hypothetical protein
MNVFKKIKLLNFWLLVVVLVTACTKTDVGVADVKLDKTTQTIMADAGFLLIPVIKPDDASNKNVTWTSNNPAVAIVSPGGYVEGVSVGSCIITVTTVDGGKTSNCTVTVTPTVGKTRAQVKAAFEAQSYTTTISQDIASLWMPAYTFEKGGGATLQQMVAIFFTSEAIAAAAKNQYDEIATGLGYTCKQDGRILYYGTASAMQLFEEI